MTDRVATVLSAGFARLAAWRGGQGVHRQGVVLAGTLQLERQAGQLRAPLLDRPGPYRVLARLSWAVGPFDRLPDVAGLGLRVLDADGAGGIQDLLVDSCRPPPRDRVLVPRRDLAGWYGTPLRLRLGGPDGPKVQVAARVDGGGRLTLNSARAAAAADRLRVLLVVHHRGRLLATGRVRLDEVPAPEARLRFDVGATAGGLVTSGFWHTQRQRTYAASRRATPPT
jgi:hypothetical protein